MIYEFKRSNRKTLAVEIKTDGRVIVRAPFNMSEDKVKKFLSEKSRWVESHLKRISERENLPPFSPQELKIITEKAKLLLKERVLLYAGIINVSYGKVSVKRQKTLWGSCAKNGNLNFNCLLALMPLEIVDYVVIHELCHRKEMNHSRAFWKIVAKYCPDYKKRRQYLKAHGAEYLNRL